MRFLVGICPVALSNSLSIDFSTARPLLHKIGSSLYNIGGTDVVQCMHNLDSVSTEGQSLMSAMFIEYTS